MAVYLYERHVRGNRGGTETSRWCDNGDFQASLESEMSAGPSNSEFNKHIPTTGFAQMFATWVGSATVPNDK